MVTQDMYIHMHSTCSEMHVYVYIHVYMHMYIRVCVFVYLAQSCMRVKVIASLIWIENTAVHFLSTGSAAAGQLGKDCNKIQCQMPKSHLQIHNFNQLSMYLYIHELIHAVRSIT